MKKTFFLLFLIIICIGFLSATTNGTNTALLNGTNQFVLVATTNFANGEIIQIMGTNTNVLNLYGTHTNQSVIPDFRSTNTNQGLHLYGSFMNTLTISSNKRSDAFLYELDAQLSFFQPLFHITNTNSLFTKNQYELGMHAYYLNASYYLGLFMAIRPVNFFRLSTYLGYYTAHPELYRYSMDRHFIQPIQNGIGNAWNLVVRPEFILDLSGTEINLGFNWFAIPSYASTNNINFMLDVDIHAIKNEKFELILSFDWYDTGTYTVTDVINETTDISSRFIWYWQYKHLRPRLELTLGNLNNRLDNEQYLDVTLGVDYKIW